MKNTRLMTGLSFMLALLMFNCNTPSNLLQEGDYDEAVYKAIKNLRKKTKKKEKDIIVVEEAFRKITKRDMNQIAALKAEGQAINWVKINELHNNIKDRQDLISPYLPLVSTKTAYKADFRFVKIIPMELASRKKAAEYYYSNGRKQMENAKSGDKQAARSAHRKFVRVNNYFDEYKDNTKLRNAAYEIGLDKVVLEMRNSSFAFIPNGFEDHLLSFNETNLDQHWVQYYKNHNAPEDLDYKVIIDLTDINVSPEHVRENAYGVSKTLYRMEKRTVQKEVLVENKKPRATATVHTDTKPKYVTKLVEENVKVPYNVFAQVIDIHQTKSAIVRARVSFYDATSQTLIDTDHITANVDFENIASTYRGDERALSSDVRCRIGGAAVFFPSDSEMVLDAAAQLKNQIGHVVQRSNAYAVR